MIIHTDRRTNGQIYEWNNTLGIPNDFYKKWMIRWTVNRWRSLLKPVLSSVVFKFSKCKTRSKSLLNCEHVKLESCSKLPVSVHNHDLPISNISFKEQTTLTEMKKTLKHWSLPFLAKWLIFHKKNHQSNKVESIWFVYIFR